MIRKRRNKETSHDLFRLPPGFAFRLEVFAADAAGSYAKSGAKSGA